MNHASAILDYLAKSEAPCMLLVAPNAPPVTRTERGVEVALNVVLDNASVADTLAGLLKQAPEAGRKDLGESGTFCFGLAHVGRLRVSYVTQRGSRIFSVANVPFNVPSLDTLCEDPSAANRLVEVTSAGQMGMLAITGFSALHNSMLVYALLQEINQARRAIIYIIERQLTFLMAHADSIVMQSELGDDMRSLEEGLTSALLFDLDLLFVGDLHLADELPSVREAVASGVFTLVSSVSVDAETLLDRFCPKPDQPSVAGRRYVRGKVNVQPAPGGKLSVTLVDLPPKNA